MKRYHLIYLTLLVLSLTTGFTHAQTPGRISGIVLDSESGFELPEVRVLLDGTDSGAHTGLNGAFTMARMAAGEYTLEFRIIGYETQRQTITVRPGETTMVDVRLVPKPISTQELLVQADRPYSAASSRSIRSFDLQVRPNRSAQDLLQLTPGLVIAQHAGGGKAEQIFLRGFDADHGTDVALSVDGMPVNMVSHGHGQGYADLHFIISDVVEKIDTFKGPYFADFGNLATAGAVSFQTKDHLKHNMIRMEGGGLNTGRFTTLFQIPTPTEHQGAYVAGQFYRTDGPVNEPQGFRRLNLFGKFHTHVAENARLAFSVSGFSSAWDASGQIPVRAVRQGLIDRFGSLDPQEGGTTGRQNLNIAYSATGEDNTRFDINAYMMRYDFKLFSNFTFFLDDPVNGDMIEQTDRRHTIGLNSRYRTARILGDRPAVTTLGGGFRADNIDVALWHSPNRIRRSRRVDSGVVERNLFLWAQQELVLHPALRIQAGLRGDYFTFDVEDRLEGQPTNLPHASGFAQQTILSPKLNLVLSPASRVDVFINTGTGFHSNDARNIILATRVNALDRLYRRQGLTEQAIVDTLRLQHFDPDQRGAETLPRATGGEVGTRVQATSGLSFGASLWTLFMDREYVYVGDAGTTELSGRTRRYGLDMEVRAHVRPWLIADADLNLSRGVFRDAPVGANAIPLAPRVTSTGGLTMRPSAEEGISGSLRYRHIGDRPAREDAGVTAQGFTVVDLNLRYTIRDYTFSLVVENALDTNWNEAQFDTESRLAGEVQPVSELHFTPGNPRNIRLGLSYEF